MKFIKWINDLKTLPVLVIVVALALGLTYLGIHHDPEKAGIDVTKTYTNVTVASPNPTIKGASEICLDDATKHYRIIQAPLRWQAVLKEPVMDANGQAILDAFNKPVIVTYTAIITEGPDGISTDVAVSQSLTGTLDNLHSEHNTPELTACIQKGAISTVSVP